MKRPFVIYLVAFWCFFVLMVQLNGVAKGLKAGLSGVQIPAEMGRSAYAVAGILIVWHIVRLIQLRAFDRWFSILVFTLFTFELLWGLSFRIPTPESNVRPLFGPLILCSLNFACIWYLGRRTFRDFAVEFVAQRKAEKHSLAMQEASRKKIADDTRS